MVWEGPKKNDAIYKQPLVQENLCVKDTVSLHCSVVYLCVLFYVYVCDVCIPFLGTKLCLKTFWYFLFPKIDWFSSLNICFKLFNQVYFIIQTFILTVWNPVSVLNENSLKTYRQTQDFLLQQIFLNSFLTNLCAIFQTSTNVSAPAYSLSLFFKIWITMPEYSRYGL